MNPSTARTLAKFISKSDEPNAYVFHRLTHQDDMDNDIQDTATIALHMMHGDQDDADMMSFLAKARAFETVQQSLVIRVWSRDCDLMEATSLCQIRITGDIDTDWQTYKDFCEGIYDNAEGPTSIRILDAEETENYRPYRRDLAAEMMGY